MSAHPGWLPIVVTTACVAATASGVAWMVGQRRAHGAPAGTASDIESAIADVESGRRTTPLVGEMTTGGALRVTFLATPSDGRAPRIVSDVTGWGEHLDGSFDFTAGTMTRVGNTGWYSLEAEVAPRARTEYLIAYAPADYRLDPHNPRRSPGREFGGLAASEFTTPGYVPPAEFEAPPTSPAGQISESLVETRLRGGPCRLVVHTPPGYRSDGAHPLAVVLDARTGPVSRVVDWLIAHHSIEPIVAVFVEPQDRGSDHPTEAALRTFVTEFVPTWTSSRYGVSRDARQRAIIGVSYRAKDAIDAARGPTGAFDKVGLLIPGRRISPTDIAVMAVPSPRRLRVAILAGRYDRANIATARDLRDALTKAGHAVDYTEVPEGHSAATWINNLRVVLVSLFGPSSTRRS
jgi:enterochelin esterase-like enzyme